MNLDNQNLEWKLCEAYFSILEKSTISEVTLDQLTIVTKIAKVEVEKIVPNKTVDYRFFFLKILISKLDREVLAELKADIADDTVSSTYDKILEGLSLRFEKYAEYKQSFKILSNNSKERIEVFFNIFQENQNFFDNLLSLIEGEQNCGIKAIKSLALNLVFIRSLKVFLKNEGKDIDTVVRHLDKYLGDMQDIGFFIGVLKK